METAFIVAIISGAATLIGAMIGLLPWFLAKSEPRHLDDPRMLRSDGAVVSPSRMVYYKGGRYQFLRFGGKNCRIAPEDGQSFKAPTHELYHDHEETLRITRESIVLNP